MRFIALIFSLLLVFTLCKMEPTNEVKLDTSDNNPVAFCLRHRNELTEEQISQFLIAIQDPEKAVALFPVGGKLSKCVKQRLEETSPK